MPPRKKPQTEVEPKTYRVRVEPYFAVRVVDDPSHAHELFLGKTAIAALNNAKQNLVRRGSDDKLLVANGKLIYATGWSAPTYPDDADLLQQVMRITGGTLLE